MKSSAGGKGSSRRPSQVPTSVVDDNWDRIFGKKKEQVCKCGRGTPCDDCRNGRCGHNPNNNL